MKTTTIIPIVENEVLQDSTLEMIKGGFKPGWTCEGFSCEDFGDDKCSGFICDKFADGLDPGCKNDSTTVNG